MERRVQIERHCSMMSTNSKRQESMEEINCQVHRRVHQRRIAKHVHCSLTPPPPLPTLSVALQVLENLPYRQPLLQTLSSLPVPFPLSPSYPSAHHLINEVIGSLVHRTRSQLLRLNLHSHLPFPISHLLPLPFSSRVHPRSKGHLFAERHPSPPSPHRNLPSSRNPFAPSLLYQISLSRIYSLNSLDQTSISQTLTHHSSNLVGVRKSEGECWIPNRVGTQMKREGCYRDGTSWRRVDLRE